MTDSGIESIVLEDDGTFPNNPFPAILYRKAITLDEGDPCASIEERFRSNGWGNLWRNGIFDDHHYHATAHEVLGCASGTVTVQLGGPQGRTVEMSAGDVVVLPAGTAHRNLVHSADYRIVGAYPPGQSPDMKYGGPEEYEAAKTSIADVEIPKKDPVSGDAGAIQKEWIGAPD